MAKYNGPQCKLCRREGMKLFLKGDRCYSNKCAVVRRQNAGAPGQHGQTRKKLSNFGLQLREKQKTKRIYGMLEKQFRLTYDKADKKAGITGENLISFLEMRLDNVVFKLGFANSRREARQLVSHGHFSVNGRKVDIASYRVKINDIIEVREKSRSLEKFKVLFENNTSIPSWLTIDGERYRGKVVSIPSKDDLNVQFNETLIVEFYSK
ncbi:30S ribosomal protein S4 [Candidatus Arthromitus sp. SFB-turkey]|uniref:30S ribosomal protein S4 n=1 Tax=Candidatus Arthromitus sp. SFB-turkey TaxID=1840217 RepID=UPI0007F4F9A4|nr:30S ribosomal protein S4 [Candidatus Arthromitus sp. SFB-turkey]OAT88827.1 30S ribosomal protein S4 [Candidatus Arthromitus sp. SFB-turkey]HJD00890.1 30S ribosomal protein S4 [Candidatus Dwaynia gallinarum]HJF36037.1 30S ribosomal protein S4 [Clostridium perfringens]